MTIRPALNRSHLIPAAHSRRGDDPIFALNAEAKARARAGESILNATVGALTDDQGRIALLPTVTAALAAVAPATAATYAPIAGEPRFLDGVVQDLFGAPRTDAVAVATPGGSGALHLAVTSFLEPGQALLAPSFYWAPYRTMAEHTGRAVRTFEMFDDAGRFHVEALDAALAQLHADQGRALVILNFPCNNPTGYSLDDAEWEETTAVLERAGDRGPLTVVIDHAYARFATAAAFGWLPRAERIAARAQLLVAWSASKAFAQYGARVGALVALAEDDAERARLANAFGYACRAVWSNCNHHGMAAIGAILADGQLTARADAERRDLRLLLGRRVSLFNRAASAARLDHPRYEGGFFVAVFSRDAEATAKCMREDGVYVVPMRGAVRAALCSTPESQVPRLVAALAKGVRAAGG